jgi:hypothetical protein
VFTSIYAFMFSYLNVMRAYAGWNIGPWKAQSTKFITPDCDKKIMDDKECARWNSHFQ